jgi:hypothetical protein
VKRGQICNKTEPTAAQTTIPHGTSRSTPSGPFRRTLFSFTFFTIVFVRISMSDSLNVRSVYAISSLLNEGSTLGRASTSVIRIREASSGYQDLRSSLKLIEAPGQAAGSEGGGKCQTYLEEVAEFSTEFDTCWATAYYNLPEMSI